MRDSSGEGPAHASARKSGVANLLLALWLLAFLSVPSSPRSDSSTGGPVTGPRPVASDPMTRWTTRRSIRPVLPAVDAPAVGVGAAFRRTGQNQGFRSTM
jgi:hypothetical protein